MITVVELLLLGTEGCHLCEEAQDMISQCELGTVGLTTIDIAEQTQWQAEFAVHIPVLYCCETSTYLSWPFTQPSIKKFITCLKND